MLFEQQVNSPEHTLCSRNLYSHIRAYTHTQSNANPYKKLNVSCIYIYKIEKYFVIYWSAIVGNIIGKNVPEDRTIHCLHNEKEKKN